MNCEVVEIGTDKQSQYRGDHIIDQRVNDRFEGGTYHDTDCHVNDIAAVYKFFEFRKKLFHTYSPKYSNSPITAFDTRNPFSVSAK